MSDDMEKFEKMDRAVRLKHARTTAGFSGPIPAARENGWNENTYKKHEGGQNGFTLTDAKKYAMAFGVRWEWLYLGEKPPKARAELTYDPRDPAEPDPIDPDSASTVGEYTPNNLPDGASPQLDVTGGMGAGGFILTSDGVPGVSGMTFAAEHISGFWQMPSQVQAALAIRAKDIVIIPVQGNSMAPTLIEGDFVFVDTRHRWPSPDGVYALADDYGGIIVKTLRQADSDQEGPHIEIVSDNPDKDRYPPKLRRAEDLRIIGRVVRRFSAVF